jgi:plasmid stabilization system protein ParE
MTYRVEVTQPAEQDANSIFAYVNERSPRGAMSWWAAFVGVLDDLAAGARIRSSAPESDAFEEPLYQVVFKTRHGNPYRVLYIVRGESIFVLRIRGFGQRPIETDDLAPPS